MRHFDLNRADTICAAATPMSGGALSVVRVSGPAALTVLGKIFRPHKGVQRPFVATLGLVVIPGLVPGIQAINDGSGLDCRNKSDNDNVLDEALCVFFPDGKSFTGEPSFELSLHGNPVITRAVLDLLVSQGCRIAEPGEFSMRAVLSGKMDLCAAESVCDLISAQSLTAAQVALRNVRGGLATYLEPVRVIIIDALCEIEARLDFPDEEIGEAAKQIMAGQLALGESLLAKLLASAHMGQRLMQSSRIVLCGKPNVGKSTLLNTLAGEDRALVYDKPGTTRDVLEASFDLEGFPATLVDVAGLRRGLDLDPVEALGIEKAYKEIGRADAVVWLSDQHHLALDELENVFGIVTCPIIKVQTKADLLPVGFESPKDVIAISAHTQLGLQELKTKLRQYLVQDMPSPEQAVLTRARQKIDVSEALEALQAARTALEQTLPDEIVAAELRGAGQSLDRLLGKSLNEDVLDLIFSRFCIGK